MPELLARLVMHDGRPPARIGRAAHPDSTDPQEHIVTFEYRDEDLDPLTVRPCHGGRPTIHFQTGPHGTYVPVNHVEELVAGIRDAARQAAGQQKPPVGYGDGKGRVYCLRCANAVAAEVPLTVDIVDHWELCPSCGRHVVDVANNQAAGQTPTTEQPQWFTEGRHGPTPDEIADARIPTCYVQFMGGAHCATPPVVEQPAEAQPAFVDELLAITRAIGRKRFAAFLAAQRRGIRAEILREAADEIDAETAQLKADGVLEPDKFRPCRDASAQLRRKAEDPR